MPDFDPRGYWEQRLSERYSLDGVGWIGLGEAFNTWMYRVRRHVFMRTVAPLAPHATDLRVLDIGSGTGFYVKRWHELGVPRITGADLTDTAVQRLRAAHPQDTFERFDVGSTEVPFPDGSFDAISIVDVLYHIVDDERFEQAFRNIARLLAPGGVLVFSENFLQGPTQRAEHQVSRSMEKIQGVLDRTGFDVLLRRPVFALLNTPLDSQSRLLHRWWELMAKVASRSNALGNAAGALTYPLELALVSRLREGPSTELMVCRRRPAERTPVAADDVERAATG